MSRDVMLSDLRWDDAVRSERLAGKSLKLRSYELEFASTQKKI